MYKVILKYKKEHKGYYEYYINNESDVLKGELLLQIKDINNALHSFNVQDIDSVDIVEEELLDFICSYGGMDTQIVKATTKDNALIKYLTYIKFFYSGATIEECTCELLKELEILV